MIADPRSPLVESLIDENLEPTNTTPVKSKPATTPLSAKGFTPLTRVSKNTSSYVKSSLVVSSLINCGPDKTTDWQIAIQQAKAYKKFRALQRQEEASKSEILTPNTKEKKDTEAQEAYRKWKKERESETLRNHIKEKKEKRAKAAVAITKAVKKAMTPSPTKVVPETKAIETLLSPIAPAEPQSENFHKSADTSFTTSMSTNFLNNVLGNAEGSPEINASVGEVGQEALLYDNDEESGAEDDALSPDVLEQSSNMMKSITDDNAPKGWPVALDDGLTEGGLPELSDNDEELLNDVRSNGIRVRVITWNQQAKDPPSAEELGKQLFRNNKFHLVVIGTEECENSIAKSILVQSKKNWEALVHTACGQRYVKLRSHTLQATHMIIMLHSALLPYISSPASLAIATGLSLPDGQHMGNKGGVGISFRVGGTSFCFVNAHLAAHQKAFEKRTAEFAKICQEIATKMGSAGVDQGGDLNPLCKAFDHVFWAGDMNYRINGTRSVVDALLEKEMHEVLVNNDQLSLAMKTSSAFSGFNEGPLNFKPTYKFDKGSDVYDTSKKKRIPSWTDRVLYSGSSRLVNYASATGIKTSDHRPVYATFKVTVDLECGQGGGKGGPLPGSLEGVGVSQSQVCLIS